MAKVHIWCLRPSDSAIVIRDSLKEKGIQAFKIPPKPTVRELEWFMRRVEKNDLWINWGSSSLGQPAAPFLPDKVLNSTLAPVNKKVQLITLANAGINVPKVYDTEHAGTVGRSLRHVGGRDLLNNSGRAYWVERLQLDREMRIHIYKGKSIHAGIKKRRPMFHGMFSDWIRTYDGGWWIDYSTASTIKKDRRDIARKAVEALGLDFGAVDVAVDYSGKLYVLEVNTAPGLDKGPSVDVYVNKFIEELKNG